MKKGTALVAVLALLIIMSLGTTAILQAMISYSNMRLVTIERVKAQYLAEAGVQFAIAQCRAGNFTSGPSLNPPFPDEDIPSGWRITITKTLRHDEPFDSYEVSADVTYPGL